MDANEKRILKALVEHPKGELSPADFINGIALRDERAVQHLKSQGYIDTTPHQNRDVRGNYYDVLFYHATHKGLAEFYPWHEKFWFAIKGDIRTILVSALTSAITTTVAITISHYLATVK